MEKQKQHLINAVKGPDKLNKRKVSVIRCTRAHVSI